jgi:hypothetical protein
MTLTHHAVRLFRLSCGCLRAYPMMPSGPRHHVLCAGCRKAAVTLFAYPERCCGTRGTAGGAQVSCTRGTAECDGVLHFDISVGREFTVTVQRLTARRDGRTGRA